MGEERGAIYTYIYIERERDFICTYGPKANVKIKYTILIYDIAD